MKFVIPGNRDAAGTNEVWPFCFKFADEFVQPWAEGCMLKYMQYLNLREVYL